MVFDNFYHDFYYDMLEEFSGDSLLDIQFALTNIIEKSEKENCPYTKKVAEFISVWLTKMAFSDNIQDLERKTVEGLINEISKRNT